MDKLENDFYFTTLERSGQAVAVSHPLE